MKKLMSLLIVLVMALILSGCGAKEDTTLCYSNEQLVEDKCVEAFTNITNSELEAFLLNPDDYHFIDVRTAAEYNEEHVPGFEHNFDYYRFDVNHNLITGFSKDKPIVLMCNSGNRSVSASNIFFEEGYTEIYNLTNGIQGWTGETE